MILTNHFKKNWLRRVNEQLPTPAEIVAILKESVVVQAPHKLYFKRDGVYQTYTLLATYWHPDKGLVLKIDECGSEGVAVSVLSAKNAKRKARDGNYKARLGADNQREILLAGV